MSLKAKIEAVIYASEEPVTLAQLTGLLAEEAQAELDALASRQQSLALDDLSVPDLSIPDQDALNAETLDVSDDYDAPDAGTLDAAPSHPELSSRPESSQPHREDAVEEATEFASPSDDKALAAAVRAKDRRLREHFRSLLDQLIADYASETRGLEIREVAGGFRLATKPEYHDAVRGFVKGLKPPLKLSLQALETLAVVAYKQPVTSPEVSEIRGVDSAGVLGSLMARKLVTTAGRKQVIGRPILYKTTKDFLMRFGLKDINELPSIEEFEKMAGELNAAVQEEIPMDAAHIASPEESAVRSARFEEDDTPGGSSSTGATGHSSTHAAERIPVVEERIPVLDERNAEPRTSYTPHVTTEDLMSEKSTALKSRSRELMDGHEAPAESQPEAESRCEAESQPESGSQGDSQREIESERRAEDGDDEPENMADEVVIDGRISGPPPSYVDDSPSAEEAREQQDEEQENHNG